MAHHAEDISKIEDIGERLDALLDALETSSDEVARIGSSLDKPLAEVQAAAPAPAAKPPSPAPAAAEPSVDSAESEPQISAEAAPEASQNPDPAPEPVEAIEPEPEPEPEPQAQAEPPAQGEPVAAVDADTGPEGEEADDTQLDDGLLIEPEFVREQAAAEDIDGAPVGPLSLDEELDQELESLLASGMFEDPLAEAGVDESAEPIDLPDEPVEAVEAPPEPAAQRKPNPPTDEAELIGELDEQLAALADAQLAEDDPAQEETPVEPEPAAKAEPAPASKPKPSPGPRSDDQPAPEVVTRPVAAPAPAKTGWRGHAERVGRAAGPVARRVASRTGVLAVVVATRASAPLKDKPQVKQIVGWVGLVQAFLAACVWVYLALWHNPPPPPADAAQPSLEVAGGS